MMKKEVLFSSKILVHRKNMSIMAVDDFSELPSFFKLMLAPAPSLKKLQIPRKFMENFEDDLLDVVHLNIPTGKVWKNGLVRQDDKAWLQHGLEEFVEYYSISYGHFLLFKYGGNSSFYVHICDNSACEIEYPFDPKDRRDIRKGKKETNVIKSNPSAPSSSTKAKEVFPLINQKPRRYEDTKTRGLTREEFKRICSCHGQNPSFAVRMQPSYVEFKYSVNIPSNFSAKYLTDIKRQSVMLWTATSESNWPVRLIADGKKNKLTGGSKKFASDNKLQVGDICVFKLLKAAKRSFKVDILRSGEEALDGSKNCPEVKTELA